MVDAFFSGMTGVKFTRSDPKGAGFIHWCIMRIVGKPLFTTCVRPAMSLKSAEMMTLGDHLGAEQDLPLSRLNTFQQRLH